MFCCVFFFPVKSKIQSLPCVIIQIIEHVRRKMVLKAVYRGKKRLMTMKSSVTRSTFVCQTSLHQVEIQKKKTEWDNKSHERVKHRAGGLCVQLIARRSRLTFPLTALNFSQYQDCQIERREEGGEVRRGRGKPRQKVGLDRGVFSVHLWEEEGMCAHMFWCSKGSACPSVITWWCVTKVRAVCELNHDSSSTQRTKLILSTYSLWSEASPETFALVLIRHY